MEEMEKWVKEVIEPVASQITEENEHELGYIIDSLYRTSKWPMKEWVAFWNNKIK